MGTSNRITTLIYLHCQNNTLKVPIHCIRSSVDWTHSLQLAHIIIISFKTNTYKGGGVLNLQLVAIC